jgi:hypothetical protein
LAAEAPLPDAGSLVLVLAAASAGAILSRLHRRIVLPTVVLEIVLGILIGPEGLDIAQVDTHIERNLTDRRGHDLRARPAPAGNRDRRPGIIPAG